MGVGFESQIDEFVDYFQATVEQAAMDLERKSSTREHRRETALWRVKSVSQCREAADQNDPWEALVDVWTLCRRMLDYFETGTGKTKFGENQGLAVAAAPP